MRALILAAITYSLGTLWGMAYGQGQLAYQERAYAFEGVKSRPVSGFDMELLSATLGVQDSSTEFGDRLHLRFYLDRSRDDVHLVVRDIDQRFYYWLDRPKSPLPWPAGYNDFSWPTQSVLRQLQGIRKNDLGVVVRLGRDEPGAIETVAPAEFQPPAETGPVRLTYVFTFKLREDARLRSTIYEESKETQVVSTDLGVQRGGRPFVVRWEPAQGTSAGSYRLVLKGYSMSANDPVTQVVRFVHAPRAGKP